MKALQSCMPHLILSSALKFEGASMKTIAIVAQVGGTFMSAKIHATRDCIGVFMSIALMGLAWGVISPSNAFGESVDSSNAVLTDAASEVQSAQAESEEDDVASSNSEGTQSVGKLADSKPDADSEAAADGGVANETEPSHASSSAGYTSSSKESTASQKSPVEETDEAASTSADADAYSSSQVQSAEVSQEIATAAPAISLASVEESALNGVDLSHHNNSVSAGFDADFAILKATQGVSYVDPTFSSRIDALIAAGKEVGLYHYANSYRNNAIDEANHFLSQVGRYVGRAILCLDYENATTATNDQDFDAIMGACDVEWVKEWLDYVKRCTGVTPFIYLSQSVASQCDWSSISDYPFWGARYKNKKQQPTEYLESPESAWPSYATMWNGLTPVIFQYSSKGSISGVSDPVDLDKFFGSRSDWERYASIDFSAVASGETVVGNHWIYIDPSTHRAQKGFVYLPSSDKWVYYGNNAFMVYGENAITVDKGYGKTESHWYYMDPTSGRMNDGFVLLNAGQANVKWVFYDRVFRYMLYGEQCIDGGWYYLTPVTGAVDYEWAYIPTSNKWVYYDGVTGRMKYGQQLIDGKPYYFDPITGRKWSSNEIIQKFISVVRDQIGNHPQTDAALAAAGGELCPGGPCMGLVWYEFQQAGLSYFLANDELKTGYPHKYYYWYKDRGRFTTSGPQVGDIVFEHYHLAWSKGLPVSHAGVVIAVNGDSFCIVDALSQGITAHWQSIGGQRAEVIGFAHPYWG